MNSEILTYHQLLQLTLVKFPLFHIISQQLKLFSHFFLNEGGNTWTRGEFGQFAEFFLWKLVQGTQAKVPKWS